METSAMTADLANLLKEKGGSVRRIVTGHRNGKSVVLEDVEVPTQDLLGAKVVELWETIGAPVLPFGGDAYKTPLKFKMPGPGETRLRLTVIWPDEEHGAGSGMHKTKTIDYNIILSGKLWMELDDGATVQLKTGDCIVQNGTRHAWRNKGADACVMLTVCIGAVKTGD
jgi:quercetin dioxygenase-like cupin family protein